jgi:hypothetical protein
MECAGAGSFGIFATVRSYSLSAEAVALTVSELPRMDYKKLNIITGWLVFLVAAWTYIATIEPTSSFWDCGEFIATAYKLEVGHPPGRSLFMILARVASAFVSPENVPWR